MSTLNLPLRTPIKNDHFGFEFLDRDFQGRLHPGEDFNGPGGGNSDLGMPVYPICAGEVSFISPIGKPNYGWGNLVYVKHNMKEYFSSFGVPQPEWCPDFVWSQYAHLEDVNVVEGQKVDQREPIATLGGTGGWYAHLHHEIRKRPLGVWYYPDKTKDADWINKNYFEPSEFVRMVNLWVTEHLTMPPETITEKLIKSEKDPNVFVYNGYSKFLIPDEETALLLFGPDWSDLIQVVKSIKDINLGEPIPSMKL